MKKLATNAYNFRLDPRIPAEKAVIEKLEQWQAQGYTVRQIVTELITAHFDIELSEPRSEAMSTKAIRRLEHLISDEVLAILKDIRSGDPNVLRSFVTVPQVEQGAEPIDTDMIEAIQRARRGKPLKRSDVE
jgi:hypothetical protein